MKRIFIDIETLSAPNDDRWFIEKRVLKTWKKQEVAGDEHDFAAAVETDFKNSALRGSLGRLLCIGLVVEKDGEIWRECVCGQDSHTLEFHLDEARTLKQFWNFIEKLDFSFDSDKIIGHNIAKFDLPFIYQRSMICGVRPTKDFLAGKPWESPVYDTFEQWRVGKCSDWISLEELAFAFKLECPKSDAVNGGKIDELFHAGKHHEIRSYCLRDVNCARQIFYKMSYQNPLAAKADFSIGDSQNQSIVTVRQQKSF